ncbi:MAG: glycosyltransferase family 4 protein [Oxalobacter formigenes]|nr:glycosyltransferase family 4 protein [Oxalobacter formigenes]
MKTPDPKQFSLFGQAGKGKLLFVVDHAGLFLSHRLPVALTAISSGYEVHIAAPLNYAAEQILESYAITFHRLQLNPAQTGLLPALKTCLSLRRILRQVQPDLLHLIAVHPVLFGSILARLQKIPAVVATIAGTANARIALAKPGWRQTFLRFGLKHPGLRLIFQNKEDQARFMAEKLIEPNRTALIRGTGVNMQQFHPLPEPVGVPPVVILPSRMRRDKGIDEFVEAARQLQQSGIHARFVLVGETDPAHPEAIPEAQLRQWQKEGAIEWWGKKNNMSRVFAQAHIVCLPSCREGLPKVLIEAAACGKPIVATDIPGCREIVADEENGLLIPARDAKNLAVALNRLLSNPDLRKNMGEDGRKKVVADFAIGRVVEETFKIYNDRS